MCKDLNSDSVLEENREEPRRQTGQNAREGAGLGEHMRRLEGEGQGAEQRPSCRAQCSDRRNQHLSEAQQGVIKGVKKNV